jgi:pantothenate synthetase
LKVNSLEEADAITACIAVYAGDIRLIDNIRIK